jgi:hypothetical protein
MLSYVEVKVNLGKAKWTGFFHRLGGASFEVFLFGCLRRKRIGPTRLEIDGVSQDQPGRGGQCARGQKVFDLFLGLLFDPVIDCLAGSLGVAEKVEFLQARTVGIAR